MIYWEVVENTGQDQTPWCHPIYIWEKAHGKWEILFGRTPERLQAQSEQVPTTEMNCGTVNMMVTLGDCQWVTHPVVLPSSSMNAK